MNIVPYYEKLKGDKLYLSPISTDDAELYTQWFNDMETTINLEMLVKQVTLENERDFLNQASKEGMYIFSIVTNNENILIGSCSINQTDFINRTAEIGIYIGKKDYWGLGYGEDAIRLLLDFAFNILNLHNIMLRTYETNKRAIACYKKCGFKEIGRRRQARYLCSNLYDIIFMDIVSSEYNSFFIKSLIK